MVYKLFKYFNGEVEGLTLHFLRIAFGFILALQLYDFYFMTIGFSAIPFHLTYDFFHFIRPVSGEIAKVVYALFCTGAIMAALGVFFKPAMLVAGIGITYSFLIDQTIYNNHYYLFILIAFLFLFTDADKGITILKPRTTARIPMRQLWVMRFMVCLVYFYGGVNKINYDWLVHAEPVYTWLPKMTGPWVLNLSKTNYKVVAFIIAYAGMLLDLLAGVFLMFENRFKYYLLPVLFVFHCLNAIFFDIGYFPYFSICVLVLFLEPEWLKQKLQPIFSKTVYIPKTYNSIPNLALLVFVFLQVVLPLRHLLIPGSYLWTERGILFSWTMKLRDKEPIINISYRVAGDKNSYEVPIHKFTSMRQLKHLGYRPLDLVQFAHFIEDTMKRKYSNRDIEVYAEIYTCLNHYRPFQLLVNPYKDLTTIEVKNKLSIENYDWIVPLGSDKFNLSPPAEIIEANVKSRR